MFLLSSRPPSEAAELPVELTGSWWTMQNLKLVETFLKGVRGRKAYSAALIYSGSMLSEAHRNDPKSTEYPYSVLSSISQELVANPKIRSRKQLTALETRHGLHRDWDQLYRKLALQWTTAAA